MGIIKNVPKLTLEKLIDRVLVRSGQYVLPLEDTSLINEDRFEELAIQELAKYNRYMPIYERNKTMFLQKGIKFDLDDPETPQGISRIQTTSGKKLNSFDWRYTHGELIEFTQGAGTYIVDYFKNHEYDLNTKTFLTINQFSKYFVDLVAWKFVETVGRNRRSFTINELPISTDADQMVSDGVERYNATVENMIDDKHWELAITI